MKRLYMVPTTADEFHTQKQPPEVLCRKGVLRNFANLIGKHLCQNLAFNKVAGLISATLLKKRPLWQRYFPVNFPKFLRTPFLQNTSGGCFCIWNSPAEHFWSTASTIVIRNGKIVWKHGLSFWDTYSSSYWTKASY